MIPYDDLVIALQTWRAKQGLPVAQMSGQLTPPPIAHTAPLTAPPSPPPRAQYSAPLDAETLDAPPAEPHEESLDVDGALIEEAQYENEGDDYAMGFAHAGASEEPPERPTEANLEEGTEVASPGARRGGNPREEW